MTTKWIDERSDDWLMSLSTRTRNFLVMAGYESRESVLSAFDLDAGQSFLKIPNFGSKSFCEVAEKLGRAAPVRKRKSPPATQAEYEQALCAMGFTDQQAKVIADGGFVALQQLH